MEKLPSIVLVAVVLSVWPPQIARSAQQTVFLAEMKQCPGKDNMPVMGYNFTLERGNRTQNYLNGDVVMTESFPNGFKVNLAIKSCDDMTDKSTCKPFINQMATNDICLLLRAPLPSYQQFVRTISPPLQCPLKKGTYRLRDFPVGNELARYMRRTNKRVYYFNRITASKNGRELLCYEFYLYATTKKSQ